MKAEELRQDWSLDLTKADTHGAVWHFDKADCRARCRKLVRDLFYLIGSPMCIWFSTPQQMNKGVIDPVVRDRERAQGVFHSAFCFPVLGTEARCFPAVDNKPQNPG